MTDLLCFLISSYLLKNVHSVLNVQSCRSMDLLNYQSSITQAAMGWTSKDQPKAANTIK